MEKEAFGITSLVGALIGIQAGRLTSRARVRPVGNTRTGESSLPAVITTRRTKTSGAEAASEGNEGVAGAERSRTPRNLPQGEPSKRAKRVVGDARRALQEYQDLPSEKSNAQDRPINI